MFDPVIWIPLGIALILPMAIRKAQENKRIEYQKSLQKQEKKKSVKEAVTKKKISYKSKIGRSQK